MTSLNDTCWRKYAAATGLCAGYLLSSTSAFAYCTDAPVDGAAYKVVSAGSALLLNVADASTSDGANVTTVANTGDASQRFYLRYQTSSHYWTIEAAHTGMLVDVANDSTSNGGNVIQASDDDGTSQEWELKQQSDGSYKIVNRNSSYSLTVAGSTEGSNVYQNSDAGYSSQRWWLEPVTYTCGTSSEEESEGITLGGQAGNGEVSLSWTAAPSGTQRIQIYYDTDSNPSGRSRAASLSTSTTSYTVSGLTNGTPYWFWVKYQNEDSSWDNSNAFSATPSATGGSFQVSGFASLSGTDGLATTTGGAGGSTVTVESCSELKSALTSSDALTVQIPDNTTIDCRTSGTAYTACEIACPDYQDPGEYSYRIPTSTLTCDALGASSTSTVYRYDQQINVASNKTLVGLGSGSALKGATLKVAGVENVIIRNLSISEVNPHLVEGGDGVTIDTASHVVVDHVSFDMISDGHVDVKASQNVTLSYNHFDGVNEYVCGDKHWYTNAVTDSQITLHHNYWDNTAGRNPKLAGSATRAHLYNNYWQSVYYFSVGVDDSAQALLEYNYFDDAARPHWNIGSGYIDANVSTNVYTGQSASGSYATQDTGDSVLEDVSMYSYSAESASALTDLTTETGAQ